MSLLNHAVEGHLPGGGPLKPGGRIQGAGLRAMTVGLWQGQFRALTWAPGAGLGAWTVCLGGDGSECRLGAWAWGLGVGPGAVAGRGWEWSGVTRDPEADLHVVAQSLGRD